MKRITTLICAFSLAGAASAGIPYEEKVECPIGGETVTYTSTMSCSSGMGPVNMLLWTPSSCDFVTRIPQCPTNGLPLYKEYSETDIQRITAYMEQPEYTQAREVSRFLLSARVELASEKTDANAVINLLLAGLRDDPSLLENETYMMAVNDSAESFGMAISKEERDSVGFAFTNAMLAYVFAETGDMEAARDHLGGATGHAMFDEHEFLQTYTARVAACLDTIDSAECVPTAPVESLETTEDLDSGE